MFEIFREEIILHGNSLSYFRLVSSLIRINILFSFILMNVEQRVQVRQRKDVKWLKSFSSDIVNDLSILVTTCPILKIGIKLPFLFSIENIRLSAED